MRSLRCALLFAIWFLAATVPIHPSAGAVAHDREGGTVRALGAGAWTADTAAFPEDAYASVNRPLRRPARLARLKTSARPGSPASMGPGALGEGDLISEPALPVQSVGFDAIPRTIATSPADPTGAVGLGYYVTAVNSHVAVYDRSAPPTQLVAPTRLRTLGGVLPSGSFDFDPKVIYDAYDDHFVLVFLATDDPSSSTKSWLIVVAIPGATADDTGTWCITRMNGDQTPKDGKQFADYPGLGFTADRVTVATNNFELTGPYFDHVQVLSFRKSQLYDPACSSPLEPKVFAGKKLREPNGSQAFTVQPAQTYAGTNPSTQYMVSFSFSTGASGSRLVLWRLKQSEGVLKLAKGYVNVGTGRIPPWGTQRDGDLTTPNTWWDTGDARLTSAAFDADLGTLYTAHAVQHDFAPAPGGYLESGVRWYEIDPASPLGSSDVLRKGYIGVSERDAAWPSVVTDSGGVLHITYSQASAVAPEYLSAYAATVQPEETSFSSLRLVEGSARYEASVGPERWGDYNAASRDPLDGAMVALVNQYPVSDGSGASPLWQQWVSLVSNG